MSQEERGLPSAPEGPTGEFSMGKSYSVSGKIMLSAIVILFFVVILMVFLHLYARWYLLRARRIRRSRNHSRRAHLVFQLDSPAIIRDAPRGLEPAVLKSLPMFAYSSDAHPDPIDCAVCLSEFEEGEAGRTLPKCNHSFHMECIDMWFQSHSNCPLCRTPVEFPENPTQLVEVVGAQPGSWVSGLCPACEGHEAGPSSGSRKPLGLVGISVEVPPRRPNSVFGDESSTESTPRHLRSPVGRMLSFTRILSRERRPATPSSSTSRDCGGSVAEVVDIERGREEAVSEAIRA